VRLLANPGRDIKGYFDGAPQEAFRDWHALADGWWPQPTGDLGERLVAGFGRAFHLGGPVLAVGTDCLEIDAGLLLRAFEQLAHRDVVFGPTPDGGYYLIGLSAARPDLFRSVRWSSPSTLDDHLHCCRENGWSVSLLSTIAAEPFASVEVEEFYLERTPKTHGYLYRGVATK
jgi:glycosyltransferase A (GT-A) superfamily protein (DUF2064 family)